MPTIEHWAARTPHSSALISAHGDRDFAELHANANRVAHALHRRGLVPGDSVAIMCANRPEFAEVLYGCRRGGFRLTPVNWHLTADEVAYIVDDCEAKALIADSSNAGSVDAFERAPRCTVGLSIGPTAANFDAYDAALAAESADDITDTPPGATMLYTSGTTGRPKGVHRPPAAEGAVSVNLYDYDEAGGDRHLLTGPLYHAAPLAFSLRIPLAFGATIVMMDKWDAEEALRLVETHRVTHTHVVPTMFHRLLALPADVRDGYDTSTLRHVLHGAAPCPTEDKRRMIDWLGPIIWEYYAATEGVGSFVDSATWLAHPGTVGRPVNGQVLIGDDQGNPLPAGTTGLVFLRAAAQARFEYFKDTEKTESTFRGDYFTLGDIGHLDTDGFLFLTDRSTNLIISGGVNIYPAEVDEALLTHQAIGDAATIGIPDEEWGESVLAVVELNDGWTASAELAEELLAHCRSRLAHYKCPRRIEFTAELPRSDNGKLYKRRLREQYRSA